MPWINKKHGGTDRGVVKNQKQSDKKRSHNSGRHTHKVYHPKNCCETKYIIKH
jgi:hypothetical protein